MNRNVKIAKELLRVAKSIESSEDDGEEPVSSGEIGFEEFKNHIFKALSQEAQNFQDLYKWYMMHYNASTRSIDVSGEILEIMKLLEEIAQYVKDSEEDDEPEGD